MLDFKAKMHQIQFRLGLRSRPRWGAYSAPRDPLAGFKGPTSEGREGKCYSRKHHVCIIKLKLEYSELKYLNEPELPDVK